MGTWKAHWKFSTPSIRHAPDLAKSNQNEFHLHIETSQQFSNSQPASIQNKNILRSKRKCFDSLIRVCQTRDIVLEDKIDVNDESAHQVNRLQSVHQNDQIH